MGSPAGRAFAACQGGVAGDLSRAAGDPRLRLKEVRIVDGWLLLNAATVLAADGLACWFWGPKALAYLAGSFVFSVGLHPVGARLDSGTLFGSFAPRNVQLLRSAESSRLQRRLPQ